MNKFTVPLLCAAAAWPLAFVPSVQGQPSSKREAHLVAFQDPDSDSGAIDESSGDYDVFYERLSSDGNWFYDDDYGYVWQPNVAATTSSWRPYADGHWVWTDRGWCWISNENFGWATYHYGRWVRVSGSGWVWVPGDEWAPAWVSWRHTDDDDYVGWAPLPPEASVNMSGGVHSWCDSYYDIGPAAFAFIRIGNFCRPSYREFIVPPQQNLTIINRTRNITNIAYNNNVIYNYGPRYERISEMVQRQGQQVPNYKINYTPQVQRTAPFRMEPHGNQLNVVAPPPKLKPIASTQPQVTKQLGKVPVDRGWQNVPQNEARQMRQKFVQQAPVPKTLPPKPLPPPKPQIQAAKANQQGQPGKPGVLQPGPNSQPPNEKATGKTVTEQQKAEGQKPQSEQKKEETQQPGKPGEQQKNAALTNEAPKTPAEKAQPKNEQLKKERGNPGQTEIKHPQPKVATKAETTHHPESAPKSRVKQASHPAQQHAAQTHQYPHSHPPAAQQHAAQPHPQPQSHPPAAQQHVAQTHPQPQSHPPAPQHVAQAPHPHPQPQKAESKDKKKEHSG